MSCNVYGSLEGNKITTYPFARTLTFHSDTRCKQHLGETAQQRSYFLSGWDSFSNPVSKLWTTQWSQVPRAQKDTCNALDIWTSGVVLNLMILKPRVYRHNLCFYHFFFLCPKLTLFCSYFGTVKSLKSNKTVRNTYGTELPSYPSLQGN